MWRRLRKPAPLNTEGCGTRIPLDSRQSRTRKSGLWGTQTNPRPTLKLRGWSTQAIAILLVLSCIFTFVVDVPTLAAAASNKKENPDALLKGLPVTG